MTTKSKIICTVSLLTAITLLGFSALSIYAAMPDGQSLKTSAKAAVLYNPETESFLYTKNACARLPMASTTKIMTALVVLEKAKLSDEVVICNEAVGVEGSSAYLKAGDIYTVEELLYALLLRSANDSATALAIHVGGSVEGFANMMNEKALSLGLTDTNFTNPHGLDDKEHYTTAHDLALIAAEALKNESFKKICSTYKKSFVHGDENVLYVNHNKLLKSYNGALGMKTGYTKKSGRCLVGAAEREGLGFITVTLDAPDDWADHKALLDLGFNTLEKIYFAIEGDYDFKIPLLNGSKDELEVTNVNSCSIIVNRGEHEIKEYVKLVKFASAPIKKDDIFGEVIFTLDGKTEAKVKLVAKEDIAEKNTKGFFKKLTEKLGI